MTYIDQLLALLSRGSQGIPDLREEGGVCKNNRIEEDSSSPLLCQKFETPSEACAKSARSPALVCNDCRSTDATVFLGMDDGAWFLCAKCYRLDVRERDEVTAKIAALKAKRIAKAKALAAIAAGRGAS